jgi:hypothetical protein
MSAFPIDVDNMGTVLIGASDRMLTAEDVQFEPPQTKIFELTRSIAVLAAGDSAIHTEIWQRVAADVNKRIQLEPDNWWKVLDVAGLYTRYYNEARLRRAEVAILAPLGLSRDTFIKRQGEMANRLVMRLASELINFEAPGVEAIIAGMDGTGAHLVSFVNGQWTLQDNVGFAAIGVGLAHANSHLMASGHTRFTTFPEALLSTYTAKKKGEVAPGVGQVTDMFIIGPTMGTYARVNDPLLGQLDAIYRDTHSAIKAAEAGGTQRITDHVLQAIKDAIAKAQAALTTTGQVASPEESSAAKSAEEKKEIDDKSI